MLFNMSVYYIIGPVRLLLTKVLPVCFTASVACKNLVQNRLKIKFVQLDFWKKFKTWYYKNQVQMDRVFKGTSYQIQYTVSLSFEFTEPFQWKILKS